MAEADRTISERDALRLSDRLIEEWEWADIILLALPAIDRNLPASVTAWLDHLLRPDRPIKGRHRELLLLQAAGDQDIPRRPDHGLATATFEGLMRPLSLKQLRVLHTLLTEADPQMEGRIRDFTRAVQDPKCGQAA